MCNLTEISLLIEVSRRIHKKCTSDKIERQIGETLKHASSKKGGYLFQLRICDFSLQQYICHIKIIISHKSYLCFRITVTPVMVVDGSQ